MKIEFFPEATRLLQNEAAKVTMEYGSYSWELPAIAVRPPYYSKPSYDSYYPVL